MFTVQSAVHIHIFTGYGSTFTISAIIKLFSVNAILFQN
jgi:hypothetical protein